MATQPTIKLLPNERVLIEDIDCMLTLTTHRIRFQQQGKGQSIFTSITLESVASCGLATVSYPRLIPLGIVIIVGGFWYLNASSSTGDGNAIPSTIILLGILLIGMFFSTRKGILKISSAGDAISVKSKGISREKLVEIIETLEQAKFNLHRQLH